MICQISYTTPGIPPQYSVRKYEFVVILKFQINDQFALNTVCISCSSYRMGSKYVKYVSRLLFQLFLSYFLFCIYPRKQLERDAIFRQHKQGSRLSNGCVRIAQFDWLIRTTPQIHKHVANKNRPAEVQNTTQKRFN